MKYYLFFAMLFMVNLAKAQRFDLGDQLTPRTSEFKLIGISSATGVSTYKYIKPISDLMFDRKIDEIVIGIKNGRIVTTIYNLIPKSGDVGVPSSIVDLIQSNLPYPLSRIGDGYGINIDNTSISITRSKNTLTSWKDRIMFFSSVKRSLLLNN
jgi:hypothetical protein